MGIHEANRQSAWHHGGTENPRSNGMGGRDECDSSTGGGNRHFRIIRIKISGRDLLSSASQYFQLCCQYYLWVTTSYASNHSSNTSLLNIMLFNITLFMACSAKARDDPRQTVLLRQADPRMPFYLLHFGKNRCPYTVLPRASNGFGIRRRPRCDHRR